MKRFATMLWAAGVLGGLFTGVQTVTAAPPETVARNCACYCWWSEGGWICQDCVSCW